MRRELIWSGSKQLLWDWSPRADNLGNPITGAGGLHLFCPCLSPHPSVRSRSRVLALLKSDWFLRKYIFRSNRITAYLPSEELLLSPRPGPDWQGSVPPYLKACGTRWHHLQLEEALGRRQILATVSSWVCSCLFKYQLRKNKIHLRENVIRFLPLILARSLNSLVVEMSEQGWPTWRLSGWWWCIFPPPHLQD